MKTFKYKITDEVGIHARPAGLLVKEAGKYKSVITLKNLMNNKSTEAKKLFGVMGLAVKCGDEVEFCFEGEDEDEAYDRLKKFVEENL